MLEFNVSLDGNDTMVGGSGGPARPRDHRGGMPFTHPLHINTHDYTKELLITHTIRCPEKSCLIHMITYDYSQSPIGYARSYYTDYHTLIHTITRLLHGYQV